MVVCVAFLQLVTLQVLPYLFVREWGYHGSILDSCGGGAAWCLLRRIIRRSRVRWRCCCVGVVFSWQSWSVTCCSAVAFEAASWNSVFQMIFFLLLLRGQLKLLTLVKMPLLRCSALHEFVAVVHIRFVCSRDRRGVLQPYGYDHVLLPACD